MTAQELREIRASMKKTKTPQQARTGRDICSIPRDNLRGRGCWILVEPGRVTLATQRAGESETGMVTLTRRDFDRFVRWYTTGQTR